MTTTPTLGRAAPAHRAWIALGLFAALAAAAAGCGDSKKTADRTHYEQPIAYDRDLTAVELDSMRSMKVTHRVNRDEYWDLKGGVIANDRIEVWYSNRKINVMGAMGVLKLMDQAADNTKKIFGRLPSDRLVVLCAPSLEAFRQSTGRDWWHYSLIKGDTMSIQTPMTLYTRSLLKVAAEREYYTWVLGKFTNGKNPHWVRAGLASYLADERPVFAGQRKEYSSLPLRMDIKEIEKQLKNDDDRIPSRRAMYNACLMVGELVNTRGMPAVASFVLALGEEKDADAAARRAFGESYDAVLTEASAWKEPAVQ